MNAGGKIVMECVIETKASILLQFIHGLRGDLQVTFEEGTWAAWLYDLLKPHVTEVVACNPRKIALLKDGSKSDRHRLNPTHFKELARPLRDSKESVATMKGCIISDEPFTYILKQIESGKYR
jgi:hypothetical protein